MKKVVLRIITIFLLFTLALPIGYVFLQTLGGGMQVIDGPFSLLGSRLHATRTDEWYDLSPWIHLNGVVEITSEPVLHTLGPITYEFYLKDIQHPIKKFSQGEEQYQVYDQDGMILVKRLTRWPFGRVTEVCAMSTTDCFYTPIQVSGRDDCAILVSNGMPELEDTYSTLWFCQEGRWEQSTFSKDGQTELDICGAVRRHPDPYLKNDPAIGNIEFSCTSTSGATLYSATFENGMVSLIPIKKLPVNWQEEWNF